MITKKNKKRACLILIIFVVCLLAIVLVDAIYTTIIGKKVTYCSLVGKYEGRYIVFPKLTKKYREGIYKGGKHFLELRSDQSYLYKYIGLDSNVFSCSSNWRIKDWPTQKDIVLSNFEFGPTTKDSKHTGTFFLPIRNRLGSAPIIVVNDDCAFYLVKVK